MVSEEVFRSTILGGAAGAVIGALVAGTIGSVIGAVIWGTIGYFAGKMQAEKNNGDK